MNILKFIVKLISPKKDTKRIDHHLLDFLSEEKAKELIKKSKNPNQTTF